MFNNVKVEQEWYERRGKGQNETPEKKEKKKEKESTEKDGGNPIFEEPLHQHLAYERTMKRPDCFCYYCC